MTVSADFNDPGYDSATFGTFEDFDTSTIDWGDGNVETVPDITVTETPGSAGVLTTGTVSGSHAYAVPGVYTIIVEVRDDNGGTDSVSFTAFVTGVDVDVNGVLQIVGTSQADHVTVNKQGNGTVKVHADFLPSGNFVTFPIADVDEIVARLCAGDDHLTIAGNIDLPAIVHGDEDDDHLNAGGGPSVLLGGLGADMLNGGSGRDILIGGLGEDRLVGGKDDDVLIGGTTDDDDDAALRAARAAWKSNDAYATRAAAIDALFTVEDDEGEDKLTGNSDQDLFYDGLGDDLTDVKNNEDVL